MSDLNYGLSSMLMDPDVIFIVTEGETVKKFPGHRHLLANLSSVFKVSKKKANLFVGIESIP